MRGLLFRPLLRVASLLIRPLLRICRLLIRLLFRIGCLFVGPLLRLLRLDFAVSVLAAESLPNLSEVVFYSANTVVDDVADGVEELLRFVGALDIANTGFLC